MNADFHKTVVVIALNTMPKSFQDFLITDTYTKDQMSNDADISDMVDKDNITQDAEIHHAHSYKLEKVNDKIKWVDGDCLNRLDGICADAHDFHAENKLDMLRYSLSKMTHYIVDGSGCTYPHNHRGQPWAKYHVPYEDKMGKFIVAHKDELMNEKFTFIPVKDIYKYCRENAVNMFNEGMNVVNNFEKGIDMTDAEKLEVCKKAIQRIGDIWITLGIEFKIIG